MEKKITDYPEDITKLSKSVMLELMTLLKGYKNQMVLVGGWVPYFILQRYQKSKDFRHVGSVDIDLVLDPELMKSDAYETIVGIIEKNGYTQKKDTEFSFEKEINGNTIKVDFLSADYPEKAKKRHRTVQPDLKARTLKGAIIALKHNYEEELEGVLPNNAEVKVKVRIVDIVGSLTTKAIALGGRSEAKDNYDIYALVSNYKDGEKSCAEELKPYLKEKEIQDAIGEIAKNFEKETSLGPTLVGTFMYPGDEDARKRVMTDSYMRINRFLELLKK